MPSSQDWTLTRRELLYLGGAAAAAMAGLAGIDVTSRVVHHGPGYSVGKTTGAVTRVPSMCQACTTACGIIADVKDGRLIGVVGNPEDPNNRGSVCAKGVAGPSVLYDPSRLLYPLRRAGARGEGRWQRITWEEAYDEIAARLRPIRESGHPERFFFQQGRNRSTDIISRFLNAFGTPSFFNHRALCSLNRRAAILATIGDSDWDLGDYENSRYILNFGCNWAEAHQGHIPVATRMMRGRERGAKIVTFESRLSNTAALSDEWFCVKPGTDGLIALAMSNVICSEGLWDKAWFDTWSNYPADAYAAHVRRYTPERAEAESGVPAPVVRRLAREFAAAAPFCTTVCNRGSHAHRNGFYNDRAITVLNALVGNMGQKGGWCWHSQSAWDKKQIPEPEPVPPKPTARSLIAEARDWPLANAWKGNEMKVGGVVYQWIKEGRQQASALMSYNVDQAWAWPEANLVREVFADERLVPFHVCIDVMYSETAHLADVILPWTTYLERWDIDSRPPQGLVDYVGLRQPVVAPLGQSKDIRDIFPELARRIGGGMERYFPWRSTEEYLEQYFKPVPGGLAYMRAHGAWVDPAKRPNYLPYERRLTPSELKGAVTDKATGIIHQGTDPKTGKPVPVGIMMDGVPRRGFSTPSRKLEVHSDFIAEAGGKVDKSINPLPIYEPIPSHQRAFADDELIMISFKWNVHNAHRTGQSKWLQEIVHTNPAWINRATAARFALAEGDWIEVIGYRPKDPLVPRGDGSALGSLRTRVHLTDGVHPQVIAISHNAGRSHGGPVATNGRDRAAVPGYGEASDPDSGRIWWAGVLSVAQNDIMPIYPDPVSGQQAYHDTIVRVRKL
jgi:thiosulfate reductase/polysulfide reductase chain A